MLFLKYIIHFWDYWRRGSSKVKECREISAFELQHSRSQLLYIVPQVFPFLMNQEGICRISLFRIIVGTNMALIFMKRKKRGGGNTLKPYYPEQRHRESTLIFSEYLEVCGDYLTEENEASLFSGFPCKRPLFCGNRLGQS